MFLKQLNITQAWIPELVDNVYHAKNVKCSKVQKLRIIDKTTQKLIREGKKIQFDFSNKESKMETALLLL